MKKIVFIFLILLLSFISIYPQVKVRSYFRKDGTFVQSHYRTYPDGNVFNNWSTKGNINPYTGKEGTIDPYKLSTPRTRVYSDYIHYPYISTTNVDKKEIIKQEIKTFNSKEYIVIRKKESEKLVPSSKSRRIIIYE